MGARFSAFIKTNPGAHPASCKMDDGSFPEVKGGRGVTLIPHPLLVSWPRKSRAIPLLPLWAVRPVQSLSACTRAHFTFTFYLKGFTYRHDLTLSMQAYFLLSRLSDRELLFYSRILSLQKAKKNKISKISRYFNYVDSVINDIYFNRL